MRRRAKLDEYGCELTPEEEKEVDQMAQDITEKIFGEKSHGTNVPEQKSVPRMPDKAAAERGADQAAGVREKKRPGRPKSNPQKAPEDSQNEVTVHEDPQREVSVIPDVVRETVLEKMDLLERMIKRHEESIWELRTNCEQEISDIEKLKTECISKYHSLRSFLEVAEHGQS